MSRKPPHFVRAYILYNYPTCRTVEEWIYLKLGMFNSPEYFNVVRLGNKLNGYTSIVIGSIDKSVPQYELRVVSQVDEHGGQMYFSFRERIVIKISDVKQT